jgi:FAD/FMN-containing dehydrogenase
MVRPVRDVARFRDEFQGEIVLPTDPDYEQARRVWNGMIDRRPAMVVRPTGPDDVVKAVRFGRENDLVIAVRGGGHSLPGLSTCDDGLVIDLSRMRGVTVDPQARTARADGGALLRELDEAAQAQRLVCPVGVIGHTGVGGLSLGGGMGRLQRRYGLTIDNILAVDLVTADGRQVRASKDENAELFWGMRGAGPNFGVVTSFLFRLHPLDPMVTWGRMFFPATKVDDLWPLFRGVARSAPDHLFLAFGLHVALPAADFPPAIAGQPMVAFRYMHSGDPRTVAADIAPLRSVAEPALEATFVDPYLKLQTMIDDEAGWGHRTYSKGSFANDLPAVAWRALVDHMADGADPIAAFGIWAQGGAMGRIPDADTAFTGRGAMFDMSADTSWDDSTFDDARIGWVRKAMAIVEPYEETGRYVNEASDHGEDVTRSIYGAEKLARLTVLKRAWDPDNVFRLNQNIRP